MQGLMHQVARIRRSRINLRLRDWYWLMAEYRVLRLTRRKTQARFTRYLTTIRRLSYDNVNNYDQLTTDVSNLQNILRMAREASRVYTIHVQYCKTVWDSVRKSAYDIPERCITQDPVVSRSYDKLKIILIVRYFVNRAPGHFGDVSPSQFLASV